MKQSQPSARDRGSGAWPPAPTGQVSVETPTAVPARLLTRSRAVDLVLGALLGVFVGIVLIIEVSGRIANPVMHDTPSGPALESPASGVLFVILVVLTAPLAAAIYFVLRRYKHLAIAYRSGLIFIYVVVALNCIASFFIR